MNWLVTLVSMLMDQDFVCIRYVPFVSKSLMSSRSYAHLFTWDSISHGASYVGNLCVLVPQKRI